MSARHTQIRQLAEKARAFHRKELGAKEAPKKYYYFLSRWALMLYRKALEDNVKMRAESLAYLMLFSILPLFAGLFYVLTLFTQFGYVQDAISGLVERVLSNVPPDHKAMLLEYAIKFKDAYLASIAGRSNTLGIFALLVLVYIGLQTFNNIDTTLNFIWSSETGRPFLEKLRNFIVTSIVGPFIFVASLSIPIVLKNIPQTSGFLHDHRGLDTLLNQAVPFVLVVALFFTIYKFLPVRRVRWRPALTGAVVAAIFLQVANLIIATYFKHGTNSAYGKAATIPIIGFWFYLLWVIVILGAELSYLLQFEKLYLNEGADHPTFLEAEATLAILVQFEKARMEGNASISFDQLFHLTRLDPSKLSKILSFLMDEKIIVQVVDESDFSQNSFVINKSLEKVKASLLIRKYLLKNRPQIANADVSEKFDRSLSKWADELDEILQF